jgi:putative ABC transport system substrate-binding protein
VARGSPDFAAALDAAKGANAGAVLVLSTPVTTPHRRALAEAATRRGLPTLTPSDHADAGALLSYGTTLVESTRRAANHVDRILKGARAGDLPVETVRNSELIVNLKTAREIGLTLPPALLAKATRVIE